MSDGEAGGGGQLLPERLINDPEHWHKRAAEIRALASHMHDTDGKRTLLRIAADYENLAKAATVRQSKSVS
jgi:hypothetical protein